METKRAVVEQAIVKTPFKRVNAGRPKGATSFYGSSVEYALHALMWLLSEQPHRASSRDLAVFLGFPRATMAKIMAKLEKSGIARSYSGISGGYELGRSAEEISVLDVVDAIEGDRRLFDCKEVRRDCVLFGGFPPDWAVQGVCGIHAVMLRAENQMRADLARTSILSLSRIGSRPAEFETRAAQWFGSRAAVREASRLEGMRKGRSTDRP